MEIIYEWNENDQSRDSIFLTEMLVVRNRGRRLQRLMSNSTTQELIFDSLRDRSDKVLRGCFGFFKSSDIAAREIVDIALRASCISEGECRCIMNLPTSDLQVEMVIKIIIKKGKCSCFNFIKQLYFCNYTTVVQTLQSHTEVDPADIGEDKVLTAKLLHKEMAYLCSNIKVNKILDVLFERRVLSIENHDDIQRHTSRPAKRKALISIILNKRGSNWLFVFIRCLQLTGHEAMLCELRCRQRGQSQGTLPWTDLPVQYVAHIANVNNQLPGPASNTVNNAEALATFSQCVDAGLVDLWEGSLYMLLSTTNPAKLNAIIVKNDIEKLKSLLHAFFNTNPSLIEKFGLDKTLKFELEERHGIQMLDEEQGKKFTLDRKHFTNDCLECFHATVRGNYTEVLDEIEEDIITDVLSSCNDVSAYARWLCLDSRKARVETAIVFLQLALANDTVLNQLRESLKRFSAVKFIKFKCQTCKDGVFKTGKEVQMSTKKISFTFKLKKIFSGKVSIHLMNDNYNDSAAMPSPGQYRRMQLNRSKSLFNMRASETTQDSSVRDRIVIVVNEGGYHETDLDIIGNHYTTYTLPISVVFGVDDKTRIKLKECIAFTSPGPHMFLVVCDIEECKDLESKIHYLVEFFGENVMKYIVVACMFNDRTMEEATMFVKNLPLLEALEHGFLMLDKTSIHDKSILDSVQRRIKELKKLEQNEYFTNDCFKFSESRIKEKMETMRTIQDLKEQCLLDELKLLKHTDVRVEATKEIASSLTCRRIKETHSNN